MPCLSVPVRSAVSLYPQMAPLVDPGLRLIKSPRTLSLSLKPRQKENQAVKKKMNILGAIGVESTRSNADALFLDFVSERISIDSEGNELNSMSGDVDPADKEDPFNIDVQKDFRSKAPDSEKNFPLFVCEKDGENLYVVPVVGKGLWGPIWGFVALKSDMETIYGAVFDHKTETPGLGAEIKDTVCDGGGRRLSARWDLADCS